MHGEALHIRELARYLDTDISQHVGKNPAARHSKRADAFRQPIDLTGQEVKRPVTTHYERDGATIVPQNANTTKYAVNGTALPLVNFGM